MGGWWVARSPLSVTEGAGLGRAIDSRAYTRQVDVPVGRPLGERGGAGRSRTEEVERRVRAERRGQRLLSSPTAIGRTHGKDELPPASRAGER